MMQLLWMLTAYIFIVLGCKARTPDSTLNEYIYKDRVRRDPTSNEFSQFVSLNGSSGVLLSPKWLMVTNHQCDSWKKDGFFAPIIRQHSTNDMLIALAPVERSSLDGGYDYCLVEVAGFKSGMKIQFPKSIWVSEEQVSIKSTGGDMLYSLGFPSDNERMSKPTYSNGAARNLILNDNKATFLEFDVSGTKGNSGGPIYRQSDGMLVSIVSGSKRGAFAPEYAEQDDPRTWSWGPALFEVIKSSKILQDIFPEGKNRFISTSGEVIADEIGTFDNSGKRDYWFAENFGKDWSDATNRAWRLKTFILERHAGGDGSTRCGAGWRYPKLSELKAAVLSGLKDPIRNTVFGGYYLNHLKTIQGVWLQNNEYIAFAGERLSEITETVPGDLLNPQLCTTL